MRTIMLLFLVVLLGCGSPDTFHGDVTFTPAERAKVERGCAFMDSHTGAPRGFEMAIVWDEPHADACSRPDRIMRTSGTGGVDRGAEDGCIYLGTGAGSNPLDVLAAHEIGHWRRLEHVSDGGVMDPTPVNLVWTDGDQAMCVRVGTCDE